MIGDLVSSLPAHPERGFIAGLFLLAAGVWLVVWRMVRRRRPRLALVAAPRRSGPPFAPRLEDPPTQVICGRPDLTEAFPAPWGVRHG